MERAASMTFAVQQPGLGTKGPTICSFTVSSGGTATTTFGTSVTPYVTKWGATGMDCKGGVCYQAQGSNTNIKFAVVFPVDPGTGYVTAAVINGTRYPVVVEGGGGTNYVYWFTVGNGTFSNVSVRFE